MFSDGYYTPSGVRIFTSVAHNVAGFDPTNELDPQTQDALRKYRDRGREIMSENSEDSLTWSVFHALSALPNKIWLQDFFRAAVNDRFAETYAAAVEMAQVRFWVPHSAPKVYVEWLQAKVRREGETSIRHLERYDSRVRAKRRLEKIMAGDPNELPERDTEVDCEIRLGKDLLVFIECKLFSDASASGTFNRARGQIVRNIELLEDVARREGFKDRRFILLTMDRQEAKLYTQTMRRYRGSDMRQLRQWGQVGDWESLKKDLPHRSAEPDTYFQEMTMKLGWILWGDCFKLLAHYACLGA